MPNLISTRVRVLWSKPKLVRAAAPIAKLCTIEEYTAWREQISAEDYGWFEHQAYWFAGLVLVPDKLLRRRFDEWMENASARGFSFNVDDAGHLEYLARALADQFDVRARS